MTPLRATQGFTQTDLLAGAAVLSLLLVLAIVGIDQRNSKRKLAVCSDNVARVGRAVLAFSADHDNALPAPDRAQPGDFWWWYKEQVKSYAGLSGASSPSDQLFACPSDRGYSEAQPFCKTARFDYSSYVFNGVILPGIPNIAGWKTGALAAPKQTLLVMEWPAHAPLSWHRSRTGQANAPFYSGAEATAVFADGHASLTRMYYDGYNAAFTRDPIPGYEYRYSGR